MRLVRTRRFAHIGHSGPFQHEGLSTVSEDSTKQVRELVDAFYRSKARQVLATLISVYSAILTPPRRRCTMPSP